MCDEDKNLCCEAINRALGTFELQLADATARTSTAITAAFPPAGSPTAVARNGLVITALMAIAQQFRAAIARLSSLSEECNSPCCESAALALRDTAIGFANIVVTAGADPNIPLQLPAPAPPVGPFNIAAILASIVGSAAFPVGTPGLPTTPVTGTLADAFNAILATVDCTSEENECEPCNNRIHIKPGRKICKPCRNTKRY